MAWRRLLVEGRQYVTEGELRPLCAEMGRGYDSVVHYLQVHGYIVRVFRGVFYVKSADERERGYVRPDIHTLIARALELRGVGRWYFALETALKLNGMTHEYYTLGTVVTGSYRTTKAIGIAGFRFRFLKWRRRMLGSGVVARKGLRFSDPEKTVLDLVFRRGYEGGARGRLDRPWAGRLLDQHGDSIDRKRLLGYLEMYPPWMGAGMKRLL